MVTVYWGLVRFLVSQDDRDSQSTVRLATLILSLRFLYVRTMVIGYYTNLLFRERIVLEDYLSVTFVRMHLTSRMS